MCLVCLAPGPALAQSEPVVPAETEPKPWQVRVTEAQKKEAQALLEKGNQLLLDRQWARALETYRKALEHWEHPYIHFNMVQCLVSLDRPLEAFEAVTKALRYGQGPLSDEHHRQALTYRKLLQGQLSTIRASCTEPGARVTLDTEEWFTCPGEESRLVKAGKHQLMASKRGFITTTRTVTALPREASVVALELEPVKVVVKKPRIVWKRRWRAFVPWTVIGLGALVAGVGVPLALKARSSFDEFDSHIDENCTDGCDAGAIPDELYDKQSSGKAYDRAAVAMFAVGGATIVAGAVLAVLNRERPMEVEGPRAKVTLLPVFWRDGSGVGVGLAF
jgi:hypothetical protein